jgi:hypothetical protein
LQTSAREKSYRGDVADVAALNAPAITSRAQTASERTVLVQDVIDPY